MLNILLLLLLVKLDSSFDVNMLRLGLVHWVTGLQVAVELLEAFLYIENKGYRECGSKGDWACVRHYTGSF